MNPAVGVDQHASLAAVLPRGWAAGSDSNGSYDVVVIGAGPVGELGPRL
ncbi:hypothetical protein ACFRCW_43115 [Streptomyces sp. NPDC056653]